MGKTYISLVNVVRFSYYEFALGFVSQCVYFKVGRPWMGILIDRSYRSIHFYYHPVMWEAV